MLKSRGIIAVLISVMMLATMGAVMAADPPNFAVADADRLFKEYTKRQQLYTEIEALKARLEKQLELRNANRLLTDQEFKQLTDLDAKAQKADADNNQIRSLLDTSKQRDQELQALQQKQDATEADTAKRTELETRLRNVNQSLQENKVKFEEDLNKQLIEANTQCTKDIEAAVAAEAKAKGFTMVFNKSFGAVEFVLYSTADITDDVLKRLNKK